MRAVDPAALRNGRVDSGRVGSPTSSRCSRKGGNNGAGVVVTRRGGKGRNDGACVAVTRSHWQRLRLKATVSSAQANNLIGVCMRKLGPRVDVD